MTDHINHPSYYGGESNPFETIKVIESWGMGWQFCAATAIKYISRAGKKGDEGTVKDLKKAAWYLNRIIEKGHEPTAPLLRSNNAASVKDTAIAWNLDLSSTDVLYAIAEGEISDALHWVHMEISLCVPL